nr:putative late blight resistance protein homolog R1B-8 [Ipomoea trifida]
MLYPIVERGNVTGFEDEEKRLNSRLTVSSNNTRIVIPIVGLPGTGKTAFAYQIFHSKNKENEFVHTIWVHVSQSFDRKQKYIDMLCDITRHPRDEYSSIAEDQLVARIRDLLNDKKYFIVLDDIWEKKDWDSLNAVLPNNSQGSRVLVTTRFLKVVDDSGEEPHILKPLDDKVSWEILKKIVFGKDKCLNESLETLGLDIAKRCNGLPLSLVMVGGILRKSRAQAYWKHVAENPFQEINRRDESYHKVVRMKKKSPYPSGHEHVHSLLLSSSQKSDIDLKQEELIAIPNAFPLLRVLDIESFKLSFQLPDELFSLNLLKYLAITTNVNLLPKAFKNLRELQTLVIKTTERTLEINGGIWNMENTGKINIHTLSSVSPTSCTKMIFSKTPHLKKLGVRGNLEELLKEKEEICLFNNLQMLKCLENLKLYGQDENAFKVPMLDKFAHRLRKLTFYKTFFKWDDIGILGSLEELEVLKLDENAFRGERWDLKSNVVFNQLQYLRIGRTNLETWTIMENNFPALENLVLRNCTNLEAIPFAFAEVHNLKVIELYHMNKNAINSARKLENVKGLDLKITPLLPVATAHEQTHDKENVNTNKLDLPSSSVPQPPPTVQHEEQTLEKENVNTSRFDLPNSSIPQSPETAHEQTHDKENVNTSKFNLPSSSVPQPPPTVQHEEQTLEKENVNTSRFDLPNSSIPQSPETAHEQTHDKENVNTSKFNLPSSSVPQPPPTVQHEEQTLEKENVNTSRFDLPNSSIPQSPETAHEQTHDKENVNTSKFNLPSSSVPQPPPTVQHEEQTLEKENVNTSRFDLPNSSIPQSPETAHEQTHDKENVNTSKFNLPSSSVPQPPPTVQHEEQTLEKENVNTSRFDLPNSSIPQSPETAHEQTHDKENVNTSKFNLPSSSVPQPPPTVQHEEQTLEKENVNTSRFDLPNSSIPQSPETAHEQTHDKENVNTSKFNLPSSSVPQPPPTAHEEQTHGKENVNTSRSDFPDSSISQPPPTLTKMAPVVEEVNVVGFDNDAKIIKDRFFRGSSDLRVISIVGMIGVGKTTLANMVFNEREMQYEFFTRIWVHVSRAYNRREIFFDILSTITKKSYDFHGMSDENIATRIKEYLEGGKYLIVLDDVWTKNEWEQLKIAFPNNRRGSRILVTTRHQNVASHIDSTVTSHELKGLSGDECWKLLEKKIFRGERCPTVLEAVGKSIAEKCNGVPLVVGKISGFLSENRTVADWRRIEPFPRESEIDARKLMYLWVAEGFVSGDDEDDDLDYTAEKYLKDFVQRNLLMVVDRRADDRIKRVRIHGLLHDICIREAAKPQNNFMREFQVGGGGAYGRGLYIHSSSSSSALALQSISSSSDHVRSFLSFSSQGSIQEIVAAIPNAFPNLQVLDIRDFKFPSKLPKELYRLQHLTYLGITIIDLKLLPKELGSFIQLQTLVLQTPTQNTSSCVKIEADIWSCMPNLRHLLTNNTTLQLPSPIIRRSSRIIGRKKSSSSGVVSKITTLSTISPSSCTDDIFDKTPNLQKLGIRGNLDELFENRGGIFLFDNLRLLDRLENLKLINDAGHSNRLQRLPHIERFPRRLRKMTLSKTAFEWRYLSALGSLDELEVLKLEDNAFRGEFFDVGGVVFKQLQYFRIEGTNLVSWTASEHSFPVLKCLLLKNCTKLEAVPVEFGKIESLKLLELYCTNKRAVISAQQILGYKEGVNGGKKKGRFQLSVYPPEP